MSERTVVLVDGGYLSKIMKSEFGGAVINLHTFSEQVCEHDTRLRTYYYTCMPYQSNPPSREEEQRYSAMRTFVSALKKLPRFDVRLGKLGYADNEFVQKGVDILLAVDLVRLSWGNLIGKAILVTGDSDFVPAIKAAKDAGVLVQLYYHPASVHNELLDEVDERFLITQDLVSQTALSSQSSG